MNEIAIAGFGLYLLGLGSICLFGKKAAVLAIVLWIFSIIVFLIGAAIEINKLFS